MFQPYTQSIILCEDSVYTRQPYRDATGNEVPGYMVSTHPLRHAELTAVNLPDGRNDRSTTAYEGIVVGYFSIDFRCFGRPHRSSLSVYYFHDSWAVPSDVDRSE